MAIVRFVYRSPPVVCWHLTVLNYWFILYGLLNSFEHCQINFTALLNITDLFGSKWWSRLVLRKGLVAFQPHLNLQYAHGFHGQISSHSLVNCQSSLCITSEPLQLAWQLESHPEFYAGYVPMDYREYLKKMSKWVFALLFVYKQMFSLYCKYKSSFLLCSNNPTRSGEWGDHVTLQAAADSVIFMYLEPLLLY